MEFYKTESMSQICVILTNESRLILGQGTLQSPAQHVELILPLFFQCTLRRSGRGSGGRSLCRSGRRSLRLSGRRSYRQSLGQSGNLKKCIEWHEVNSVIFHCS